MAKNIVIAVDAKERTLDALALGHRLADATGAPAVLVTVFPYHPLDDAGSPELVSLREEARDTLLELAGAEGLEVADAEVIAGNFAARELQRVTERPDTGVIVVGSTTRGPVGRLLLGGVGERLMAGGPARSRWRPGATPTGPPPGCAASASAWTARRKRASRSMPRWPSPRPAVPGYA